MEKTLMGFFNLTVNCKIIDPTIETKIPCYAKLGDAGLDLIATSRTENALYIEYGTNLAFELPEGYVGLAFPRSSISNYHLNLANCVGVLDSGYRGEVKFRFRLSDKTHINPKIYEIGDKIGQLIIVPIPNIILNLVEELSTTERGEGGYGSSGK